jgi:hypothetical protein
MATPGKLYSKMIILMIKKRKVVVADFSFNIKLG